MKERKTSAFTALFALLVFLLFSVLSLLLVLTGAKAYRGIVNRMESNQQTRVSLSYVVNKVHAAGAGEVSLQNAAGHSAIVISSHHGDRDYRTYIYEYNGALFEWFTRADKPFQAGQGEKIVALSGFSAVQDARMLRLSATGGDGATQTAGVLLP